MEKAYGGAAKRAFRAGWAAAALAWPTAASYAALDYRVLDSGAPGAALIVYSAGGEAGNAALRQLEQSKPARGRLVLVRPRPDFQEAPRPAGWEEAPDAAALEGRFGDAPQLVLREEEESHAFDPRFLGDTVQGSGAPAEAVLKALRGLESAVVGKDWRLLPGDGPRRRTVVTTNARPNMEGGLRPVVREREFRTAAAALQRSLAMVDDDAAKTPILPAARGGRIRVAVYDGPGAVNSVGRGPAWLRARLARDPALLPELVDVEALREGVLEHADVLLVGGGKSDLQSKALGEEGREIVRKFVQNGGGYVGICAGAYLGGEGSAKWKRLELLPVQTDATYTDCKIPLVWSGGPVGGDRVEDADLHGGPLFRLNAPESDAVRVWARFDRNETNAEKVEFALKGTPAVLSGRFGKGKVLLVSTHCERPPTSSHVFPEMLRWAAGDPPGDGG